MKSIKKAPRNRTLSCSKSETSEFGKLFLTKKHKLSQNKICNNIIRGNTFEILDNLPKNFVDLLILDPPYNLQKNYDGTLFQEKKADDYKSWFSDLISLLIPRLKKESTVYICADWRTSTIIAPVLENYFNIKNRITWERDKGRGAKTNWKNNSEDIWYCTLGKNSFFNVDAVKLKRKVIAPYKKNGSPKGWEKEDEGNFRLTHPSNLWTDITVPFWSMPENTIHPTQKPEKLIAKLILASSKKGDMVFDPFLGSGTTAVVAKKLLRNFSGIEQSLDYCCLAQKRLLIAEKDKGIQGYINDVFWERNTNNIQSAKSSGISKTKNSKTKTLFDE